jgi:hypothetical protein
MTHVSSHGPYPSGSILPHGVDVNKTPVDDDNRAGIGRDGAWVPEGTRCRGILPGISLMDGGG